MFFSILLTCSRHSDSLQQHSTLNAKQSWHESQCRRRIQVNTIIFYQCHLENPITNGDNGDKKETSEGCLSFRKNKLHKLNTGRYFSPFSLQEKCLNLSWGTDDIFLASSIHYLIIHHVFCGKKKRRKRHADTGASPNFEKRVLASIQQQPNCLHSVYMTQNLQLFFWFSHIKTSTGQTIRLQHI